jgi:LacI family transcriptional regulator
MRIACVIDPEITYYRRVLKGMALFTRSRADLELRVEYVKSPELFPALDRAGYDGLILGTFLDQSEEAGRLRTPAVSVSNTHAGLRFPQVVSDDCEAGRMVARHLLAKGYRHFAFWGSDVVFGRQRWEGFAATIVGERGVAFTPARTAAHGRAFARWLRRLPRPMGLMTATDAMGSEAMNACHGLGWRVPQDVAVVGVDDDDLYSELTQPPLSSVALQTERIGYLATDHLVRLVRGAPIPPVTLVPPGPLMARQSSHAVAAADALVVQAVAFLEQNLARGTNIDALAGALDVSRRSLELRFKAALGQTPGQELLRLKIERARGLLATTSLPLKKIATLAGFSSAAQMSHVFRHATDQTPMGYRRGFLPH